MPRSKKPSLSAPQPLTSSESSLRADTRLQPGPVREMVLAALEQAERELNQTLFASWHRVRTNPESIQAERRGVEAMKLRAIALLTGGQ